jgi:hypothetical protein
VEAHFLGVDTHTGVMEAHHGVVQINLESKPHPKGRRNISLEPLRLTLDPWTHSEAFNAHSGAFKACPVAVEAHLEPLEL